jgi:hypothetical protein
VKHCLLCQLRIDPLLCFVLTAVTLTTCSYTQGRNVAATRTSENAFVTWTPTAMTLKKRIFALLGIEEFRDTWADGLQVTSISVTFNSVTV